MFKQNFAVLSAVAVLAAASVAQAVPTLRISDGTTTVTVTDNGVGDTSAIAGFVSHTATIGGWQILLTGGATKPLVGSATQPQLDLSFQVLRIGAGNPTLTICFGESGFNLASAASMQTSSGVTLGTGPNTAVVRTYYSANNDPLGNQTLLSQQNFTGPGGLSDNDSANAPQDNAVAFSIKLDLTQAIGEVTSGDIHLRMNVPEGGSMVTFLGTALLALGAFAARRKA